MRPVQRRWTRSVRLRHLNAIGHLSPFGPLAVIMAMVTVNVPDGVFEGQEFLLEYEGQQLTVCCPDGCGPGIG